VGARPPVAAAVGQRLVEAFDRPLLNGIKLVFGGEIAEVRIDGARNEAGTEALQLLDWPRVTPFASIRCFVLAVHGPEHHS
jgi:hypothetical protein